AGPSDAGPSQRPVSRHIARIRRAAGPMHLGPAGPALVAVARVVVGRFVAIPKEPMDGSTAPGSTPPSGTDAESSAGTSTEPKHPPGPDPPPPSSPQQRQRARRTDPRCRISV